MAAAVHAGAFGIGAPMALLSAVPPVSMRWLVPALAAYGVWVVVFARVALTRGLVTSLITADLAVTVLLCLGSGRLVPLHRIDEGSSWTAAISIMCVVTVALAWPGRFAVPAGLLVPVAYLAGFPLAGLPAAGYAHAVVLVFDLVAAAVVIGVLRRAGAAADTAFAAAIEARGAVAVAEARRTDESAQLRLLHDTALTTLTLVGTGAVSRSATLTRRAAADLTVVEQTAAARTVASDQLVRLDDALAAAVRDAPGGLSVAQTLAPCTVPAPVADALARCVGEALRNVDRHAGVTAVTLRLSSADATVRVEVTDRGCGFDPAADTAHRYGVRESIVGRLAAVSGVAHVRSAPGNGTQWTLRWPDGVDR